ncbi:hypothetical protein [Winogradskya humida]|uniref:Uncharacterized protein n=1 Tax=Winogradskya humida TaxID=113566 RepID=A0ABQ4A1Z4_9ACTN|nr:hypothetical protein [Actinoplanes humidus]GIE24729.1 hypothetical protein Ahu01nite_078310 [Actinoplanes humidus]
MKYSDWGGLGLRQFQLVQCRVSGHRGRFGVEVIIERPVPGVPAFIDFVLLSDNGQVGPDDYPAVGQLLDAVTIDIMPNDELRLSSSPSSVARAQRLADDEKDAGSDGLG